MFQCSKANSDNEHPTLIILRRYYLNSKEGFQEGGLGGIPEIELHHVLLLAGNVGRLGRGVHDVAAVAGQLLHHIVTPSQPADGEGTVGRGP